MNNNDKYKYDFICSWGKKGMTWMTFLTRHFVYSTMDTMGLLAALPCISRRRVLCAHNISVEAKTCSLTKHIRYVSSMSYICATESWKVLKIQSYIFKIKTISKDMPAIHVDLHPHLELWKHVEYWQFLFWIQHMIARKPLEICAI